MVARVIQFQVELHGFCIRLQGGGATERGTAPGLSSPQRRTFSRWSRSPAGWYGCERRVWGRQSNDWYLRAQQKPKCGFYQSCTEPAFLKGESRRSLEKKTSFSEKRRKVAKKKSKSLSDHSKVHHHLL